MSLKKRNCVKQCIVRSLMFLFLDSGGTGEKKSMDRGLPRYLRNSGGERDLEASLKFGL
jgi:hypothetical protein